ncbi:MAG: VOC family protein [Pseudomonadales bacterium]|nr:VOC family protein [Pseudomonadales bacterium]
MNVMPTLLRVSNVDQSIQFYTQVLGLQLLRKQDYPAGRFTLASLGYDDEEPSSIELSHNWAEDDSLAVFVKGRLRLEVDDAIKVCDQSKYAKGEVLRYTVDKQHHSVQAIIKDPDGHVIKVVERTH